MNQNQVKLELKLIGLSNKIEIDFVKLKPVRGKKLTEEQKRETELKIIKLRKKLKRYIENIRNNPNIVLIDYTAISTTQLKLQKNRYLLNKNGNYYEKGLVVALTKNRKLIAVETTATQLRNKDIKRLRKYLDKDAILVSDKQHKGVLAVTKGITQIIENYFGGLKTPIYPEIEQYQQIINDKVVTNISFEQLEELYYKRYKAMGIEIKEKVKPRIIFKKL